MSVKQGPPSARRDCGSNEPGQDDRMARWRRFGNNKTLEVPSIDGQSCLMGIRQQYQNWPRAMIWCSRPDLSMALSVKPSLSGHPRNVRQSLAEDAKPGKMIVGRESGSAPDAGGTCAGCATSGK